MSPWRNIDRPPLPAFDDPLVQAILTEQVSLEAAFVDVLDLPNTHPAVIAYIARVRTHAERCIEFGKRVSLALNAKFN